MTQFWITLLVVILLKKEGKKAKNKLLIILKYCKLQQSYNYRVVKIGEKEIDFNVNFRLILHTKLSNPHYKPEMQAQTTLINFTVNRDQLEDQLLAEVVKVERPDLEKMRIDLTKQQNSFKIMLKQLEDGLLQRLASAGSEILGDKELVLNLEKSKKTAIEIESKVVEAKITSKKIDSAREEYRVAATRASIIYFIMNDLVKINPMYQFSLEVSYYYI